MIKTVLVTGCGGFVGRHIADELESTGYVVYRHELKIKSSPNGRIIVGDLAITDQYSAFPERVDGIVHAAGYVPRVEVRESESESLRGNVLATYQLLQWAATHQVQRFVFCSTLSVYGVSGIEPFSETDQAAPISLYAITKRCAESLITAEGNRFPYGVAILRLSTLVGPGVAPVHFIPSVAWKFHKGEDVEFFGNPNNAVDYMHISDAVKGIRLALDSNVSGVFNIGSGVAIRLEDLAMLVCAAFATTTATVRTVWNPSLPVKNAILNPQKAERDLGFRVTLSPTEAVRYYLQQEFAG